MDNIYIFPIKGPRPDPLMERLQAVLDEGLRLTPPEVPGVDPVIVCHVLEAVGPAISEGASRLCSALIEAALAYERETRGD